MPERNRDLAGHTKDDQRKALDASTWLVLKCAAVAPGLGTGRVMEGRWRAL